MGLVLLAPLDAASQTKSHTLRFGYPDGQVVVVGQGWDTQSGRPAPTRCVDGSVYTIPGSATSIELKSVQTGFDLAQSLDIGSTTKLDGILGKGSASNLFKQELTVNGAFANVAGIVKIDTKMGIAPKKIDSDNADTALLDSNPGAVLVGSDSWNRMVANGQAAGLELLEDEPSPDIRLLPDKRKLAGKNPTEFRRQCGDTYVSLVYLGGRLTALITFMSTDLGLQLDINNKLSGSMKIGGSIDEHMDVHVKATFKHNQVTYRLNTLGPPPSGEACDLSDSTKFSSCLATTMQNFVNAAQPSEGKTLSPLGVMVSRYDDLANWPGAGLDVRAAGPMDEIASLYSDFQQLYQTLAWLNDSSYAWNRSTKQCEQGSGSSDQANGCFLWQRGATPQQMATLQDDVLDVVRRLRQIAAECLAESDKCAVPDDIGVGKQHDPYAIRARLPMPFAENMQPFQTPTESAIEDSVRKYWIARVSKQRCDFDLSSKECLTNAQIDGYAVPATARAHAPPLPAGSYRRSCKDCRATWGPLDTPELQCSCGTGSKKKRKNSSISWGLVCNEPVKIANCRGNLKCPDKC